MSDITDSADIERLIVEFQLSGLRELHLRHPQIELYLSSDGSASSIADRAALTPEAVASEAEALAVSMGVPLAMMNSSPENAVVIGAPNLGTFYRSPKPGAASFVEVGSQAIVGTELCLIEVMKLFTTLRASVAGRVHAVLVADGDMVEAGQPLFMIVPD